MSDLIELSASQLVAKLRAGDVSSVEVCTALIQRIERVNPKLQAVVVERFEAALQEARDADARRRRGEMLGWLHGLPVTVKEMFDVAGLPTTVGILSRKTSLAKRDAEAVRRWRHAGAIVLGKTNVPQLGLMAETDNPLYHRTNNPWDLERSPGGSSGGEAAIIAAHGSPLGLASDGGGSIRQPAHACGLVGFKPTGGRFSMFGHWLSANWPADWSQPGPIARRVSDVELGLAALAPSGAIRPGYGDVPLSIMTSSARGPRQLRVGYYEQFDRLPATAAVRRAVVMAVDALRQRGVEVVPFTPPSIDTTWSTFRALLYAEGLRDIRRQLGSDDIDARLRKLMYFARIPGWLRPLLARIARWQHQPHVASLLTTVRRPVLSADQYCRWVHRMHGLRYAFGRALDRHQLDALIGPPSPVPAWTHQSFDANETMQYTAIYNVLGLPAGVVPVTRVRSDELSIDAWRNDSPRNPLANNLRRIVSNSAGLPIGVQIVGRWWQDDIVLSLMRTLEQELETTTDFPGRIASDSPL